MTFSINRKALEAELALLQSVAERKGTIPILSTVLVQVADGKCRLVATDMDTSLITSLPASGDEWTGCIPSKQLYELTRLFTGEDIQFAPEVGRIAIRWEKSRHRLTLHNVAAFPEIAQPSGGKIVVQGEPFRKALSRVLPCATTEESRYTLQGVKFEARDSTLRLIATNGHRLGVATLPAAGDFNTLVPVQPLAIVLKTDSETVDIQADENRAAFHCGPRTVSAQLIAGTFPNWEMIMPKNQPFYSEIMASDMVNALRRADVTRAETYKAGEGRILAGVKLVFDREAITIATDESDRGDCEEPISAVSNLNGSRIALRINPDYVMDFLRNASEQVKCELRDGTSFITFTDSSDFECIIAPMRL